MVSIDYPRPAPPPGPGRHKMLRFLIGLTILLFAFWTWSKFAYQNPIAYDEDGNVVLAPHREQKKEKKLKEYQEAVQYALLAVRSGNYVCYNCPDTNLIFLNAGEVWKYGFTTKGTARYQQNFYRKFGLEFFPQLEGSIQECMEEEIRKIYDYPKLPEARARPVVLERPPGNKVDS